MELNEGKVFLFTFDEIRVLLYSLGFTSCEGIFMPGKDYTGQKVLQTVNGLVRRGLLEVPEDLRDREYQACPGKEQFVMRPWLYQMMMAMGNPSGTMIYRPGEKYPGYPEELYSGPEYFCYFLPDYCLLTERDWTRKESMRLRAMDMKAFTAWRQEQEEEAEKAGKNGAESDGPALEAIL